MAGEISTKATGLMIYEDGQWKELVRIKSYSDLGTDPDIIEVTDMDDLYKRYIDGTKGQESIKCTCNFYKQEYEAIKKLEEEGEEHYFAIYFGGTWENGKYTPTGDDEAFYYSGHVSIYVNGGDVGAVREMTVTIVISENYDTTDPTIATTSVKTTSTKKTSE